MEKVIAKSGISGSTLKLIAIFTMLIDHIAATVILQMINNGIGGQTLIDIYWVMRSIGRMAFPVFCFLLVEGFKYTHSREKYAARMFIFALISEIPFDLAINNTVLEFKSNNVFFTLLLGLLAITAAGVGCIVMMYLLSSNRDVAFAVAVILLGLFSGTIEFFALFMLIPLRYYNGKRGISLKYVFYAFYPVHLFVLYLICRLAMAAAVHT